jgi:hypothetical protein
VFVQAGYIAAAFGAFFSHQNGAGPIFDPASRPRSTAGSRKAAAAVSCVVMVLFFFKLAESLPLLVRSLLTKIEQDLLSTQPLGQETPLDSH